MFLPHPFNLSERRKQFLMLIQVRKIPTNEEKKGTS